MYSLKIGSIKHNTVVKNKKVNKIWTVVLEKDTAGVLGPYKYEVNVYHIDDGLRRSERAYTILDALLIFDKLKKEFKLKNKL